MTLSTILNFTCDRCRVVETTDVESRIFDKGWIHIELLSMTVGSVISHRVEDDNVHTSHGNNTHFCSKKCAIEFFGACLDQNVAVEEKVIKNRTLFNPNG